MKKRIFISACEPSAELHCANLIDTVNAKVAANENAYDHVTEIEWVGLGGEKMSSAGCELIENTVSRAAMIYNVFGQIGWYWKLIGRVKRYFKENKVDLCIVCDSPAFNFHIARAAKKAGTKVMFYVAPQLWAWAPWRIGKLRRLCDKLACILPFEKDWFAARGVDAEFVGNPLLDELDGNIREAYKNYFDYEPGTANVALLPGSRDAEIETLWPAMQDVGLMLREKWPGVRFTTAAVSEEKLAALKEMQFEEFECEYVIDDVPGLARRSDMAMVASGSATLQVAAAGCPMVIMYQSNPWMWHLIGRWLIRTRHLSLVNILAKREAAPEYMPYFRDIEPIYERCVGLLSSKSRLNRMSSDMIGIAEPMAKTHTASRVAELAIEMLQ
ncbi:Lipid-A-disaccharide synthase [Anaerohalosphaera lusitana]|uniref:Lipid-A-disaccharide synthase n=1 Tax=Anaerohalosphaera lusitana TaxID=1936003 RepID=A0A1U9NR36_9BACT|nr:lipid-A-disaccharide synthase [Anaerohalosphaera lusitana]AQT70188.1 Lipid-A-disaccharide synthase [Anaerohalosphaera lusitana]